MKYIFDKKQNKRTQHSYKYIIEIALCIHPNNLAYSVAFMLTIVIDNSRESTYKHMLNSFMFVCFFRLLFVLWTSRT